MRRPEEDLLERLIGHRARLRLQAVFVEHVAHARADDPVQLLGLLGHHFSPSPARLSMQNLISGSYFSASPGGSSPRTYSRMMDSHSRRSCAPRSSLM